MDQALKQEDMPSGGIADFIYTDEEIKLLEDKELKDLYGQNGIAQFKTIGKEMANFGRYGDDTIAHVETGELIVPRALIEGNPKLKESIFGHLRDLGIDDPERYVVGTSKNSLNPETGLPEFFLKKLFKGVKKTVSSIGKGVSKALKGVGKALKKVAPIIVPLALNYFLPGLGQVYSGALGAGITTLMQGGKIEDAFKSALIGGATGAVTAGLSGPRSGLDGFGQNVMSDVNYGTQNISEAFSSGSFKPLTDSALPSIRNLDADPANNTGVGTDSIRSDTLASSEIKVDKLNPLKVDEFGLTKQEFVPDYAPGAPAGAYGSESLVTKPPSMYDTAKNYLFRAGKSTEEITLAQDLAEQKYLANAASKGITPTQAGIDAARSAAGPSFLTRVGPTAALGVAGLAAAGGFDKPEDEDLPDVRTGYDVYQENPDKFNVQNVDVRSAQGPFQTDTSYGFQYNPYLFSGTPFQTAADGGEIFPRRNGGISPREGTPGKDSVRAMLMPGEFVMTTNAVKGLGDGNLDKGIKNMYSVMSKLEKRGRAMA